MAKQLINVGTSANSRTGDNLRTAFIKINENFDEVYNAIETGTGGLVGPEGPAGPQGSRGPRGPAGTDGTNGLSAYQIAVVNGFVGTEQEWLDSLKGTSGHPGSVYITDVNPVDPNDNVANKVFSGGGKLLDSFLTDTNNLYVDVLAKPGVNYIPVITVNGQQVTLIEQINGTFTGTVQIDLNNANTIVAVHEDGPTFTTNVTHDPKPLITSATFYGSYPGSQTELKAGDTFDFNVKTNIPVVAVEISDFGAFNFDEFVVTDLTDIYYSGTIANRGNTTLSQGFKVRVQKDTGTWSDYYITNNAGVSDGVHIVKLNNTYPTITFGAITYPNSQHAIKNSETATIAVNITNGDEADYLSLNNELSITNPTTLEPVKTVQRIGGSYNISSANFKVIATRTTNGASTPATTVINIAHSACTVSITEQYTRLRLGGTYNINIVSNQVLLNAPSLTAGDQGVFQGSGFTGSNTTWTRQFFVDSNDIPGTYTWSGISATNLAGITTNTISGDNTYTIGGFTSRSITLGAYSNEAMADITVSDYSKLQIQWEVKDLPNKRPVGTTDIPDPNSWCIEALDTNPTLFRILDVASTYASSKPTTIIIEELV